jgi:hypothetical protein
MTGANRCFLQHYLKYSAKFHIIANRNYTIFGEPRAMGDGYYESVVLDPEGEYFRNLGIKTTDGNNDNNI